MNYTALIIGTALIIILSWFLSIKYKRYHGITRFFSFESILLLVLLNTGTWFKNPFSLLQILSWILLILSLYVAIAGFYLLYNRGRPGSNFEDTSKLVKTGIYGFIRHPLYLSLLLLGFGAMLKDPGTVQLGSGFINLVALWFTCKIEEKEMIAKFGDEYKVYMLETKMLIPFIV